MLIYSAILYDIRKLAGDFLTYSQYNETISAVLTVNLPMLFVACHDLYLVCILNTALKVISNTCSSDLIDLFDLPY